MLMYIHDVYLYYIIYRVIFSIISFRPVRIEILKKPSGRIFFINNMIFSVFLVFLNGKLFIFIHRNNVKKKQFLLEISIFTFFFFLK